MVPGQFRGGVIGPAVDARCPIIFDHLVIDVVVHFPEGHLESQVLVDLVVVGVFEVFRGS